MIATHYYDMPSTAFKDVKMWKSEHLVIDNKK